jgi:adenosylhomocysteine nucleosidase
MAAATLPGRLIVMALEIETQGLFASHDIPVLYTGLGKVNAAIGLTRSLSQYRHAGQALPTVINFGTAGSPHFSTGSLVGCHRFVQRDMDVRPLGYPYGVTPFEKLPAELEFPVAFADLPQGLCGSGDSFATGESVMHCEVVDMEAYAYAKVCRLEGATFACAKFITDGADHNAHKEWAQNLKAAASAFLALYQQQVLRGAPSRDA